MATHRELTDRALNDGNGILRLMPNWVPRSFCVPGKRIKLHPDHYYAYGAHRGGIDERWFSSTTRAQNGPETLPDEGLSYIYVESTREKVLLRDALASHGKEILGAKVMEKHGGWTMYSKFFDNQGPLPFHLHHTDAKAAEVAQRGKPEAYYFPRQLNNHAGHFPYTFFGLHPRTTREELKRRLADWDKGDNGVLFLSSAYKLELGTGWNVPPGVLHAPGTLLTYEPQRASDISSMFQSIVWDAYIPRELLTKDVPDDRKNDLDYLVSLVEWELNVDADFHERNFTKPKPVKPIEQMRAEGYEENWIAYKSEYFSAKELTVLPGRTATIQDEGAYGAIVVQGRGRIGALDIESPAMIRFGEMTHDELFVTEAAAKGGLRVTNTSGVEDLVMLKHFGPSA